MKPEKYDFSCWVIKYDGRSIYGRVYQKDSLKSEDGKKVPLCWNHNHFNTEPVLGSAVLESREGGIFAYGTLYDKPDKEDIINLIRNKDVALSPYVNRIIYDKNIITSGVIGEVSLVPERIDPDEDYYPVLKEE